MYLVIYDSTIYGAVSLSLAKYLKIVWAVLTGVVLLFGSISDALIFVDEQLGWNLTKLPIAPIQLILLNIGIMSLFFLLYDLLKLKPREVNWRDGVLCKGCGRVFDFQHSPETVKFSEDISSVTAVCPYCKHEDTYPRKDWVINIYDSQNKNR